MVGVGEGGIGLSIIFVITISSLLCSYNFSVTSIDVVLWDCSSNTIRDSTQTSAEHGASDKTNQTRTRSHRSV